MDMTVARTIKDQVGGMALAMIGAKNLVAGENYLQFKVGKGPKKVNLVKITLTPADTYHMQFMWAWGSKCEVKSEYDDVYADMLCDVIESATGLYTHF